MPAPVRGANFFRRAATVRLDRGRSAMVRRRQAFQAQTIPTAAVSRAPRGQPWNRCTGRGDADRALGWRMFAYVCAPLGPHLKTSRRPGLGFGDATHIAVYPVLVASVAEAGATPLSNLTFTAIDFEVDSRGRSGWRMIKSSYSGRRQRCDDRCFLGPNAGARQLPCCRAPIDPVAAPRATICH